MKNNFIENIENDLNELKDKNLTRRSAIKKMAAGTLLAAGAVSAAKNPLSDSDKARKRNLELQEFIKKNYKVMTKEEKLATVKRLEEIAKLKHNVDVNISSKDAIPGVLFGYGFNISRCGGYQDCVTACQKENNLSQDSNMQYIKIFESKLGESLHLTSGNSKYQHEIPVDDHFYMGTQCFHCENPPCVKVCPTQATWKEPDGIVVVDYDWCIGCRYCEAACPYFGRRFNWSEPVIPKEDLNTTQHYLGNRPRTKGVMEKCTFCIQRSREGKNTACVEACPTGARVFGNLLDPQSEIRYVLENKTVFRLKEELNTEPKFWYFKD